MSGQSASGQCGLYRSGFEHDNCGIGAIVPTLKRQKSHITVANALKIVENLEHRVARMPKVRQVTELESYYRYHKFSPKSASLSASF